MTELKEWPLSLLIAAVSLTCGFVAFSVSIGCFFGPGWGWGVLAFGLLIFAKQANDLYQEERQLMKGHQS